jgi:hypothetical protein
MPRLRDSNPNNVMSPVPPVRSATPSSRLVLRNASGKFVTFLGERRGELPTLRDSNPNSEHHFVGPPLCSRQVRIRKVYCLFGREKRGAAKTARQQPEHMFARQVRAVGRVGRCPNPLLAQLLPGSHYARFASGKFVAFLGRELPRLRDSITGGQRHNHSATYHLIPPHTRDELGK